MMLNDLEEKILQQLVVYKPKNSKIRIGGNHDGGYVIVADYDYDCYVSCGIGDNVSFDNHFVHVNPNLKKYLAFDGTCDRPPYLDPKVEFIKKNISIENTERLTNLNSETEGYENIFLKMDIEGHEWNFIKYLGDLGKYKQIVCECHGFFDENAPSGSWKYIANFEHSIIFEALQILNKTHYLVHIHGNNAAIVRHYDGSFSNSKGYDEWLTVGELTFLRKDCEITGVNTDNLPVLNLDFPNYSHITDVHLNKWPFVTA